MQAQIFLLFIMHFSVPYTCCQPWSIPSSLMHPSIEAIYATQSNMHVVED